MPTLIATKAVRHGGEFHDVGGRFEATQQHARVLIAIGKAKLAPDEDKAEPESVDPKGKGTYNRRDLKAKG